MLLGSPRALPQAAQRSLGLSDAPGAAAAASARFTATQSANVPAKPSTGIITKAAQIEPAMEPAVFQL